MSRPLEPDIARNGRGAAQSAGWKDALKQLASVRRGLGPLHLFSILSLVTIAAFSVGFGIAMSHFLAREILQRDAVLTSQFVTSIAEVQGSVGRLGSAVTLAEILDQRMDLTALQLGSAKFGEVRQEFYDHLRFLPDVLLVNVFARDKRIIWSTNPSLTGMVHEANEELDDAFHSRVTLASGYVGSDVPWNEVRLLNNPARLFVENYVPLYDARGQVAAVVEIYKEPRSLAQTVRHAHLLVWGCTIAGAVFLYFVLLWVMRRADAIIKERQIRQIESETLVVIAEMSAAVAHGIRAPLAAIRSSAELALDAEPFSAKRNARDIIAQADRLSKWVRDLLVLSRPASGESEVLDLAALIEESLKGFQGQLADSNIAVALHPSSAVVPRVLGNRSLIGRVFDSLIANAIEAMPTGGRLAVEIVPVSLQRRVDVIVSDSGAGMSDAQLDLAFKPFYTTKKNGLGLGLPLVRRTMGRYGGSVTLQSREGEGTKVRLTFAVTEEGQQ